MLNALRRGAKTSAAKILIIVLAASFAVFGATTFVNQIDPTQVAKVGSTEVSAEQFARLYRDYISRMSQQMGPITPQQAQALGLPQQVLATMLTEAIQVDAARALGVDVGDEALAERIRADQVFAGGDGGFSRARFDFVLQNNGYTEADFIDLQRRATQQEMFVNSVVGGLEAPTPYLAALNRYQGQTRQLNWFEVSEDAIGPIPDPTDDELRAFYNDNKDLFRAPETRTISTVTLSASTLADPDAVPMADVERAYNQDRRFGAVERRLVQQVILDDMATARDAAEAIDGGEDFTTVLERLDRQFEDVDLGLVERGDLVDPAVAEAAFGLSEPGVDVVDGRFGPVLVRVARIDAAERPPLADVEAEIRREIAIDEAREQVDTLFDSVEDAVAGGARVAEIAERFDLPLAKIDAVTDTGLDTATGAPAELPNRAAAVNTAYTMDVGDDAIPVQDGDTTSWVQLDAISPSAERLYDDVADSVLIAWVEAERVGRVARIAEEALDAVTSGTPMSEVADRYGATVIESTEFSRADAPPNDLPQPLPRAAFEGPRDHADTIITEDGRHVVFEVASVTDPVFFRASADLQPIRQTLNQGVADTLLTDFVTAWQDSVGGARQNVVVLETLVGLRQPQHQGMP